MRCLVLTLAVQQATAFTLPRRAAPFTLPRMVLSEPGTTPTGGSFPTQRGTWSPSSWRKFETKQLPDYPDLEALERAEEELARSAPLCFAGEMRELKKQLAQAQEGHGFLLMGGDCAESFDEFSTDHVRDTLRVILQMALVITYGASQPVIKIGRMAGQFAKPRSSGTEKGLVDGEEIEIPSYKGDNVNSQDFTLEARTPNPQLMVKAYHQCAQTLNILRAFVKGGYADIARLQAWNLDFVSLSKQGSKYRFFAAKVEEALRFIKAIGVDTSAPQFTSTDFYVAHECLLLQYEEALTRRDSTTGDWYDCSAHMVWVGERTRQLDCGHLEFVRGLNNPIGVKISDKSSVEELTTLLDIINPENEAGRVVLIIRMGNDKIREHLPALMAGVAESGRKVLWISDPVHGNTITAPDGRKTRPVNRILDEIVGFFDVCGQVGVHPGGIHLEMTGEDVTECVGGDVNEVPEDGLGVCYRTHCDPRLNKDQALEIAFQIAERFRNDEGFPELCHGEECEW